MTKKFGSNALGKGLRALIKDRKVESSGDTAQMEKEKHARNMEFYGSLVKKYVASGMDDELIDQMLEDIRKHLGVSEKEHETLLSTLRKRDAPKHISQEEQEIAHTEIKEELSKIYMELKKGKKHKSRFKQLEDDLSKGVRDAIPLTNGKSEEKKIMKKVKRRRLIARDLDERAGIINGPKEAVKGKLEWIEEEEQPIMIPGPKEGMEEEKEPMKMPPPRKGFDEESGPTLEMPPSVVPPSPSPGFVMKDVEGEKDKGMKHPESQVEPPEKAVISDLSDENAKGERLEERYDGIIEEELEEMEELSEQEEDVEPIVKPPGEDMEEKEVEKESPSEPVLTHLEDSLLSLKMLIEEGRFNDAYQMAKRLLDKEPDNISILNEQGVVLYHMGRIREAQEVYRSILDIEPDSVETLINYATILSFEGELDRSLEYLDKAVKKDPYSEDAWNNKAVVLSRAGRLREALECLDEALRINDKAPSTWTNAGIILEKLGEYGPAMECYRNLLELEPGNKVAMEGIEYCRQMMRGA